MPLPVGKISHQCNPATGTVRPFPDTRHGQLGRSYNTRLTTLSGRSIQGGFRGEPGKGGVTTRGGGLNPALRRGQRRPSHARKARKKRGEHHYDDGGVHIPIRLRPASAAVRQRDRPPTSSYSSCTPAPEDEEPGRDPGANGEDPRPLGTMGIDPLATRSPSTGQGGPLSGPWRILGTRLIPDPVTQASGQTESGDRVHPPTRFEGDPRPLVAVDGGQYCFWWGRFWAREEEGPAGFAT
jgi:hypothetical protein